MSFTSQARSQFVTANLLVLFACLFSGGCKRSATVAPNAQLSASGGSSAGGDQPPASSPASSNGDQSGSLADRLKAVQDEAAQSGTTNSLAAPPPPLPDWRPWTAATSIEIPLVKGLVVDSIISSVDGDLEDIETTKDVNAKTITKNGDTEHAPKTPGGHPPDLNAPPEGTGRGTIVLDVADVASSKYIVPYFANGGTMHNPGALDRGVSTETLKELRSGKLAELQIATDIGTMLSKTMKGQIPPTTTQWGAMPVYQCNLQRVEPKDIAFPVLVNNEPVELPVIHAQCLLDNKDENDFYILDQLTNPIFLYTRTGKYGDSSQTIKIAFGTKDKLEQELADKKPVEIYGIYFDFNSAHIKPESEAVLKEISDVMHKNPAWKLSVSGHTDNIGGEDFNLKLSQARALAVKTALANEYKIAPDRLTTSGYGASRPVADNKKPEGRALNRRVELQRQ